MFETDQIENDIMAEVIYDSFVSRFSQLKIPFPQLYLAFGLLGCFTTCSSNVLGTCWTPS